MAEETRLAQYLKQARSRLGLSVRDVAAESGLTLSTVSRLETGHIASPRPKHLQRLARALQVDVEDLYALAGYLVPEGLPGLQPYLRAKYGLADDAARQVEGYVEALRDRTAAPNREEAGHDNRRTDAA